MSRVYGIDTDDGNELASGLDESNVQAAAHRHADRLGKTVTVYSLDGAEDDDGDWHPAEMWTVSPSSLGADDDTLSDSELRDERERDERHIARGR